MLLLVALSGAGPVTAVPSAVVWAAAEFDREAVRAADRRLFTLVHRLATANYALCDRRKMAPGLLLHAPVLYSEDARNAVGFFRFDGPVAVEVVVHGAGTRPGPIRADDGVIAISGKPIGPVRTRQQFDAIVDATESGAETMLALMLRRENVRLPVTLARVPSCAVRGELAFRDSLGAATDGSIIQLDAGLLNRVVDENELAAAVAHELAHVILDHPARLAAAGIDRGLLGGAGRNGQILRSTEIEADRLSVHLLHNAGFAPVAAAGYWRRHGRRLTPWLRSGTHPSVRARLAAIDAELRLLPPSGTPSHPALVASRKGPLSIEN